MRQPVYDAPTEAVRQAGEAALMAYAAPVGSSWPAVMMVYRERLLAGEAAQVIHELTLAHCLALVRLAEIGGVPLTVAAADLVSLTAKGA